MGNSERHYAGFWVRTGASLIDSALTLLITFPLVIAIYGWAYFDPEQSPGLTGGAADFLISWVLPAIVVITFWVMKQATPGKMAVAARIVDAASGEPASTGQLVGRYFAYILSAVPLCLGFLWVAFDGKKQGWHDKLAGTVVVRGQAQGKGLRRGLGVIGVAVVAVIAIAWFGGSGSAEAPADHAVQAAETGDPAANENAVRQHGGFVEPVSDAGLLVAAPATGNPSGSADRAMAPVMHASGATSGESNVTVLPTIERTAFAPAARKAYARGDLRHCLDHQTNAEVVRCVER